MSDDDSAEDDDWFERAVRGDGEARPTSDGEPDEATVDDDASPEDGWETATEDWATAEGGTAIEDESVTADGTATETGDRSTPASGDGATAERAEEADTDAGSDGAPEAGQPDDAVTSGLATDEGAPADSFDGGDADGDELDAAFEAAAAAASEGDGQDPFDEDAADLDFGQDAGGSDPGEGGSLFEDDFASAFGSGESESFDEDDFDSDIPRIDIGIGGLDRMIRGGVPERHLMVAIGSAGTGKTTFALQYLNHGLENGENAVFITLEQSHDSIIDTAAEHGWDFEHYEAEDNLAVIDLDPIEMANSLDNIRGELPALIEEFDADRFVLDSVSLLEMMYDDQARRRTEVFDFTRSLKRAGVTTLLTSEADEDNPYASRHGIIEYLTDAVFILQYVRAETQETRLAVEIQKIRNANHSRETKPYEITDQGISVYEQANIF